MSDSLLPVLDSLIVRRPREPLYRSVQLRTLQILRKDVQLRSAFERWVRDVPDAEGPWTIASVTNTGAHLRLVLSDASGTEIPADLRRRSPRAAQIAPGMRVHLRPEHASVFPAETA